MKRTLFEPEHDLFRAALHKRARKRQHGKTVLFGELQYALRRLRRSTHRVRNEPQRVYLAFQSF